MDDLAPLPSGLVPLPGGWSGETFLAEAGGERSVVRIYGGRSAARGPTAPEIDAAVLELVRGLMPVAPVLELRLGSAEVPGLLVTGLLPGERLDLLLPRLDPDGVRRVGAALGLLAGRIGHVAMPRPGRFVDAALHVEPFDGPGDLPGWVAAHAARLGLDDRLLGRLTDVADAAQDLLDRDRRTCLVHADLNPKNLLVDPATLTVTGLLDWEFAHAGSPYADLGNLLRFDRDPVLVEAVLTAYAGFMPAAPDDLLRRARSADLWALVDLAVRRAEHEVAARAHALLTRIADAGDVLAD